MRGNFTRHPWVKTLLETYINVFYFKGAALHVIARSLCEKEIFLLNFQEFCLEKSYCYTLHPQTWLDWPETQLEKCLPSYDIFARGIFKSYQLHHLAGVFLWWSVMRPQNVIFMFNCTRWKNCQFQESLKVRFSIILAESVGTSYQCGYSSAKAAQYLLVFCKPFCPAQCYFWWFPFLRTEVSRFSQLLL